MNPFSPPATYVSALPSPSLCIGTGRYPRPGSAAETNPAAPGRPLTVIHLTPNFREQRSRSVRVAPLVRAIASLAGAI